MACGTSGPAWRTSAGSGGIELDASNVSGAHDIADRSLVRPTVAIVGVGAIGVVVADVLSGAADVVLCRRGTNEPMRIRENSPQRGPAGAPVDAMADRPVEAMVVGSPAELLAHGIGPLDWVVVTTKAQDVASAGAWFDALVGPETRIAVLQNGIGHADRVARWAPADRVLPATVFIVAERTGADLVELRALNSIVVPDGALGRAFSTLAGDRLPVRIDTEFSTTSWRKLILNSALNSVTTLTSRTADVCADPAIRPVIERMLTEGLAVAAASGIAFGPEEHGWMLGNLDALPPGTISSMQADRRSGRPLEHDYITGELVRRGQALGVDVSALQTIHALLDSLRAVPHPPSTPPHSSGQALAA